MIDKQKCDTYYNGASARSLNQRWACNICYLCYFIIWHWILIISLWYAVMSSVVCCTYCDIVQFYLNVVCVMGNTQASLVASSVVTLVPNFTMVDVTWFFLNAILSIISWYAAGNLLSKLQSFIKFFFSIFFINI